jgi:hypothetical protein
VPGVVRPLLKWQTQFYPNGQEVTAQSAEKVEP